MNTTKLNGVFPPVFTPFKSDGSINPDIIPSYAKYLSDAGVHGVYVTGTAGEGMSLTIPERKIIAKAWIESAKVHSLETIIQVGAGCLKDTQDMAAYCEQEGSSAIATFPNLFDKPLTVEDLVDYCYEVGKCAPNTPLLYYHIPFKTGTSLPMDEFLEKGHKRIPTLSGMKYTDNDVSGEGKRCLQAANGKMKIFSGFDQLFAEAQRLGYCGGINCCFNFIPKEAMRIFNSKGEGKEANEAQQTINQTLETIFKQTGGVFSVSGVKAAMKILTGIDVGPARKPLKNLTHDQIENLRNDLNN